MNDATKAAGADDVRLAVDAEHPWLGLASFSEETRGYFYGREEEVAELCRRVQRKQLTILFGQSGLGKTSILRAGIVPRLRPEGYCPVYVRIDYSPDSPVPTEQIKQAIFRATQAAGAWTQPGAAVSGESLWEFLHHRDDVLRDASGKALIPLLIFDQFEELFTLAQSDDFGRQRAAQFIEDLSDLVENRAPEGARSEDGPGRVGRRGLRLHAQRLSHPDRAARGLPGPPGGIEGQHALDFAEPHAACPHDGRAGARGRRQAGRAAGVRGSRRLDRPLRRRRRGTRQCRSRTRAAVAHLPRTQQRAHRAGPARNFRGPAGRLARQHPLRVLRARAGRPARRRPPVRRGQPAHRVRPSRKPGRGARAEGPRRRRRAARCAGHAGQPAAAAHRGAAGRAPRRAHARRAHRRRQGQPRPAPGARGARRRRTRPRRATRARNCHAQGAGAGAPDRHRLRRARGRRRRGRGVRLLRHEARAGSRVAGASDARDGRAGARRGGKAHRLPARRLLPGAGARRAGGHRRRTRQTRAGLLPGAASGAAHAGNRTQPGAGDGPLRRGAAHASPSWRKAAKC